MFLRNDFENFNILFDNLLNTKNILLLKMLIITIKKY